MVVHRKSSQRKSWDFHGHIGWYVGPAMNHYRCFRIFLPHTNREIISDTIRFFPKKIPFPHETVQDRLIRAVEKIEKILNNVAPIISPNIPNRESATKSFAHISKLLKKEPTSPPITKVEMATNKNNTPEPRVQERISIPALPSMPKLPSTNYLSSDANKKNIFRRFYIIFMMMTEKN